MIAQALTTLCAITAVLSCSGFGDRSPDFSYLPGYFFLFCNTSQAARPPAVGPTSRTLVLHCIFSLLTHFIAFRWLVCGVKEKVFTRDLLNITREILCKLLQWRGGRDFSIELSSSLNIAKTAIPHFTHLINDQIITILLHRYFCISPLPESDSLHFLDEFL